MNKRIKVKKNGSLVAKYTALVIEKINGMEAGEGSYAYRGQENSEWEIESSASRRIRNTLGIRPNRELLIRYHEDSLLEPARMDGYGIQEGRELHDLELLAELRHRGAATCLIDFTTNFNVALWFACYEGETTGKNDGKVFVLNINDFGSLNYSDLKRKIRPIIETSMVKDPEIHSHWHWAPHGMNRRILKQDSLFVFGEMGVDDKELSFILIKKEDKEGLIRELGKLGVSRKSLFKDLDGFASMNGHLNLISTLNVSAHEFPSAGNDYLAIGGLSELNSVNAHLRRYREMSLRALNWGIRLDRQIRFGGVSGLMESSRKAAMLHDQFRRNFHGAYFLRTLAYKRIQEIAELRNTLNRALKISNIAEGIVPIQRTRGKLPEHKEPREDIPF